ncbi:MAG: VanW family protein [Actinomycetota bacterium]|nr:VanW family protein [Actinomycetota bacterium]
MYAERQRRVNSVVAVIAAKVDREAFPGKLEISANSLRVRVIAPRPARAVNRRRTAQAIVTALRRRDATTLALPVKTTRGVGLGEVESVAREARRYLTAPLVVLGAGPPINISPRRLSRLLQVEEVGSFNAGRVRLGVDAHAVGVLVERLADRRDRAAVDARLNAPPAPVIIDEKLDLGWSARRAVVRVERARLGRRLLRSAAKSAIVDAVRRQLHTARVPVLRQQPALTTKAARRAKFLIGTFTTYFECCQPRVTNIRLIARAVDGVIISPGERFSLNAVAGRRTRVGGYVPAPFIADGKVVPSVGGGVSQFATTMYNAAYFAGLAIDSHQPHSFYIPRYPPGREATLDYPSIDLAWTNDTYAPILVRAVSTASSVSVTLYGDNDGRRVRAESGPRVRLDGRDFAVTVTRVLRYRSGRSLRQAHSTSYDEPPPED